MPGTSSNSSTAPNAPCSARYVRIAAAVAGPMPGSASSSAAVARFRSTGRGRLAADDGVHHARRQRGERRGRELARGRDVDAVAVTHQRGEVERVGRRAGRGPARRGDRIADAAPGADAVDAGRFDGTGDVHHQLSGGGGRDGGGDRRRRRGARCGGRRAPGVRQAGLGGRARRAQQPERGSGDRDRDHDAGRHSGGSHEAEPQTRPFGEGRR